MTELIAKYKILKEHNLIIEYYFGDLELDSLINHKQKLTLDSEFSPGFNCFINLKNVTFKTTPEDITNFVSFIKEKSSVFGKRRIALIKNSPNQVVSTSLYKILQQGMDQSVEIFSTYEKALKWLNIDIDSNDIIKILQKLKTSS
ncbi:hypothetical protein [Lutibacter sp. B1]|uniref:hypothetical protein n=1 Tax=Lutibacter sp. B1 TaxID=2725996 RepID=UPI00145698D0|nr:hypothetical protein [Lutibacter sp. B1]NLP56628.1 hypothetical protein [Lutibacter sp. B1]